MNSVIGRGRTRQIRIFALAVFACAVAWLSVKPASAETLTYSTFVSPQVQVYGPVLIEFIALPSTSVNAVGLTSISYGVFTVNCFGGGDCNAPPPAPGNASASITLTQTSPTSGTVNILAAITAGATLSSSLMTFSVSGPLASQYIAPPPTFLSLGGHVIVGGYIASTTVPLPAAGWLLFSGAGCMLTFARHRQVAAA
jgi:hypothetical protein